MNDLNRFLSDQAEALLVPAGDPRAAVRRGTRRRARRRVSAVAGATAVALLAVNIAVRDGGDRTVTDGVAAATVTASPLSWSLASPGSGLAYEHWMTSAATSDGLQYRISTAPGGAADGDELAAALYQSVDGVEWGPSELPDGFRPRSVTGAPGAAYVVGTVPAGGSGQEVAVARAGTDVTLRVELPADLAALAAEHPEAVRLTELDVAALDDQQLLVSTTVRAVLDADSLVPGVEEHALDWSFEAEGLMVTPPDDPCSVAGLEAACAAESGDAEPGDVDAGAADHLLGLHPWAELGVDPALAAIVVDPVPVLMRAQDGRTFEAVELPVAAERVEVSSAGGQYHLMAATRSDAFVFASDDGASWEELGRLDGRAERLTALGDDPMLTISTGRGLQVLRHQAGHGFLPIDLLAGVEGQASELAEVAVGPLGIAGLVYAEDGGDPMLVFSPDGRSVSATAIGELVPDPIGIFGLHVTADAVFVRAYDVSEAADPSTVAPQVVLVGTP